MMSFIKFGKHFGRTIASISILFLKFQVFFCKQPVLLLCLHFLFLDVCAVEFQKRDLPHTHLLVELAPEFKFHSLEDVDFVILAEILDKNQDPVCYEIVSKFMMHGRCGAANPKAQCMEKNKCSKRFPKKKKDATVFDENGFVYYKRRLWVTLLKLTFLSQIIMLSHTTKNFCSDTMHTLMLKFVVNPCISSIFLSMLANELIDAEWL